MSFIEKIYNIAPVCIQNVMCSVKGYLIYRRRYNKSFFKHLEMYEKRKYDPKQRLTEFMNHIKDVPFYKKIYQQYNFDANAADIYEEITKLPIINKETVKNNIKQITNPFYKGKVNKMKTSGTTGGGLVFPYSEDMENQHWAIWWRYRRWHGIKLDTWYGHFSGLTMIPLQQRKPPYWRVNTPGKQVRFSAYHLNNDTVKYYYDEIKKRQLTWLHGYPSQISVLAALMIEKGLTPIQSVTHITTSAENLLENQKEILKKAFPKAIIRQHYGQMEGVAGISEDAQGNFAVDDDFCYIEFLPVDNNPNLCRIIGTGIANEAFPLVRYDTGDLANIETSADGTVKIIAIDGRKEDFISMPNGVKIGRLDYIFRTLTNVREAQIHQKDLHHIVFNIVKGNGYTDADERALLNEIRERIDHSVEININYLDKIERTPSGKLRFVVSDLNH